jgi:hypothetical protein
VNDFFLVDVEQVKIISKVQQNANSDVREETHVPERVSRVELEETQVYANQIIIDQLPMLGLVKQKYPRVVYVIIPLYQVKLESPVFLDWYVKHQEQ